MAKKHNVATLPTSGPLPILPPAPKRRGFPRRQGLYSHLAHLWATSDPRGGRGYVATLPTSGGLLILSPALKRRGSPRRQGLCSHLAHNICLWFVTRGREGLWANSRQH